MDDLKDIELTNQQFKEFILRLYEYGLDKQDLTNYQPILIPNDKDNFLLNLKNNCKGKIPDEYFEKKLYEVLGKSDVEIEYPNEFSLIKKSQNLETIVSNKKDMLRKQFEDKMSDFTNYLMDVYGKKEFWKSGVLDNCEVSVNCCFVDFFDIDCRLRIRDDCFLARLDLKLAPNRDNKGFVRGLKSFFKFDSGLDYNITEVEYIHSKTFPFYNLIIDSLDCMFDDLDKKYGDSARKSFKYLSKLLNSKDVIVDVLEGQRQVINSSKINLYDGFIKSLK